MRRYLSLAMVGILIGGLTAAFAQSGTLSAKDQQLFTELGKSWETAYNKKDAAGVAALYAEDGTAIVPAGIFEGALPYKSGSRATYRRADTTCLSVSRACMS